MKVSYMFFDLSYSIVMANEGLYQVLIADVFHAHV